jgi:hypothetical protein
MITSEFRNNTYFPVASFKPILFPLVNPSLSLLKIVLKEIFFDSIFFEKSLSICTESSVEALSTTIISDSKEGIL